MSLFIWPWKMVGEYADGEQVTVGATTKRTA